MANSKHTVSRFSLPEPWASGAKRRIPLKDYTTFQIGGPAEWLIEIDHPDDLVRLAGDLDGLGIDWRLMGGGSNVLVSDEGFSGLVVLFRSPAASIRIEEERLVASGGAALHDAVMACAKAGLGGLEFAAGIPGTLGGAICGNAGAFGRELGDVFLSATLLSKDGRSRRVDPGELGFRYRHSNLKDSGDIVLETCLQLKPGDSSRSRARVEEILTLRRARHPDIRTTPSAGSFFRNIEPTSNASRRRAAGALLEEAGAKAMRVGRAAVFYKHANIIVNQGGAACDDVVELARRMRRAVLERFGIGLVREVQIWSDRDYKDLPGH